MKFAKLLVLLEHDENITLKDSFEEGLDNKEDLDMLSDLGQSFE
jgi:hypothetical protein